LAHHSKKIIIMEIPQNRRFNFELYNSSPLVTYLGERRTSFFKAYKSEEVWGKCWGKYWEPIGNLKGT
jgi:hypothetical protein